MTDYIPKWHRELEIFSKIKPLIILEGNVLDVYQYPAGGGIMRLPQYLHYYFKELGYRCIAFFDSMQGFYNPCENEYLDEFARLAGTNNTGALKQAEFKGRANNAAALTRLALNQSEMPAVVVLNLASRYIVAPDRMDQAEVDSFTSLQLASLESRDVRTEQGTLKNLELLIVNKSNDLPVWFHHDNPNARIITLGTPAKEEREQLIKGPNFASFFNSAVYNTDIAHYEKHPDELAKIQDKFVGLTEGFTFTEINSLRRLCKNEKTRIAKLPSVVDLYKFGIMENPWDSVSAASLQNAHADFQQRVKGQDFAITKTLDVVKRAVTGMAGLQHSSASKPKGVLFYVGPTGTGKTETAKTLAEKLFGDERCCIRFDMSEYGQSHSDQRLLGAPPCKPKCVWPSRISLSWNWAVRKF